MSARAALVAVCVGGLFATRPAEAQAGDGSTEALESAAQAREAPDPSIRLTTSGDRSPLIGEAILRIGGELTAAGFAIADDGSMTSDDRAPRSVGALGLTVQGTRLDIEATFGNDAPIRQSVDLTRPGTTAEVLAVRAVETLRAAFVQSLRALGDSPTSDARTTRVVRRFAHLEPTEAPPAVAPKPVVAAQPVQDEPPAREKNTATWQPYTTAAPLLRFDTFRASPGLGAEVGLGLEHGQWRLGLLVDATFLPANLSANAGTVTIREFSGALRAAFGWAWSRLSWQFGASLGAISYDLSADPTAGYTGTSARMASALVQLDTTVAYWLAPSAGPFCGARGSLVANAPVLVLPGQTEARLGWPALSLSCGLGLRF